MNTYFKMNFNLGGLATNVPATKVTQTFTKSARADLTILWQTSYLLARLQSLFRPRQVGELGCTRDQLSVYFA